MKISVPNGKGWAEIRESIAASFQDEIWNLSITEQGHNISVSGRVMSETIKELLQAYFNDLFSEGHISFRVIVESPLSPATKQPDWNQPQSPQQGGEIVPNMLTRFPSISANEPPKIGRLYAFQVDLSDEADADTVGDTISIEIDDDNWTVLTIDVEVQSDQLEFDEGDSRKTIELRSDKTSRSAKFVAMVNEHAALTGDVSIIVSFSFKDRVRGFGHRRFPLATDAGTAPTSSGASGAIVIDRSSAPSLTIKIRHSETHTGECVWSFEAPWARNSREASSMPKVQLGVNAHQYFREKFAQVRRFTPGKHVGALRGIGEKIWEAAPQEFKDLYASLRKELGPQFPIQIFTNEPHVPWELMFPDDNAIPGADHLCMTHPMARWTQGSNNLVAILPDGCIASFVPRYDDEPLAAAVAEGEFLVKELGATEMKATFDGFRNFLAAPEAEKVAIVHFAGHGAGQNAMAGSQGLRMTDDWFPIEEINSSVKLGKRDRSFVVLNACEVGTQTETLGSLHGWPSELIKHGFGAVIAPFWAVQDEHAGTVIKTAISSFYHQGFSLGRALTSARQTTAQSSAAAFAYVCYGDVMATMA